MRFIQSPEILPLFKETNIVLHIDNRDRGDIIKQIEKITDLGCEYSLEIKKKKNPKQAYIWTLITKLADKKEQAPVTVYKKYLSKVTEPYTIYVNPKNYASFKLEWEGRGEGYHIAKSIDYKEYIKCTCIKGLSGMNEAEKSNLIEELIKECRRQGIYIEGQNERVD